MARKRQQFIVPPEGGWKPRTVYHVNVRHSSTNVEHKALFYSGFLNHHGEPCGYNQVWSPSYEAGGHYEITDLYSLSIIKELNVEFT